MHTGSLLHMTTRGCSTARRKACACDARLLHVVVLLVCSLCVATCVALDVLLDVPVQLDPPADGHGGARQAQFMLLSGQEPVDTLEAFRIRHGQSRAWRQGILVQLCRQPRVECHRERPVVFSTRIESPANGGLLGELELLEGVEPADAVLQFAHQHHIGREGRVAILEAVCARSGVGCTRFRSLLYKKTIEGSGSLHIGELEVYDDVEPVDQIYRFVIDHDLPLFALDQLMASTCSAIGAWHCQRVTPFVYVQRIASTNEDTGEPQTLGTLQVSLDEEPADAVYAFGLHYGLAKPFRRNLLHQVCADKYVRCKRHAPIVFASPVAIENGTEVGVLTMQEDEELADAVHKFARQTNITRDLQVSLLQALCGRRQGVLCTRAQALLRSMPVSDAAGHVMGVVQVYEGQEPADVVYQFAAQHGISPVDRDVLLDKLCAPSKPDERGEEEEPLECSRYAPVVFAVPVAAQNGSRLGILEVLANEEPADAVARFGNKHKLSKEEKQNIVKGVCDASGLPCTRNVGILYEAVYTLPDGQRERLPLFDGQETTDVIYDYGLMRNLTLRERQKFLHEVCNEPRGRPNCTRAEPMLLSIPVWESADKKLGDVEILEGQEPVDVIYAFMEKHDLFQTEPLNTTLIQIVCNSTRVECTREKPRRTLFSVQATYGGLAHTLQYVRPESDWICEQQTRGGQRCVHYAELLARAFCERHMHEWTGCEARILEALRANLENYEVGMWRAKDQYAKLGLVKTASREEIDAAYNTLVKRFNNETEPYKYEKLKEAYRVLSDPEEKYYYDLPCVKLFGCLCGKRQKDGGITFTPD